MIAQLETPNGRPKVISSRFWQDTKLEGKWPARPPCRSSSVGVHLHCLAALRGNHTTRQQGNNAQPSGSCTAEQRETVLGHELALSSAVLAQTMHEQGKCLARHWKESTIVAESFPSPKQTSIVPLELGHTFLSLFQLIAHSNGAQLARLNLHLALSLCCFQVGMLLENLKLSGCLLVSLGAKMHTISARQFLRPDTEERH